ncbi:MAG: hypothetical protein PHW60_02960 [Kiritimatiellae bacterium]|nr:hypothetical protein [Kiritimatiellia bacterium]
MNKKTQWIVLAIILAVAGMCVKTLWFTDVFTTHGKNETSRKAIRSLHEVLTPGNDRKEVLAKYYSTRSERLSLNCNSPDYWIVTMPAEFSAKECWMLAIGFTNGIVSYVRMRSLDGPKPAGSPSDK